LGKSFRRNLKAVSPVIATIIIVAIAIVMAIAVAYWMLGMGGAFTRYEKLEFASCYATKDATSNEFVIHMKLKNTGSAAATIDIIFFNAVPDDDDSIKNLVDVTEFKGETLDPGEELSGEITLDFSNDSPFKSGMSLELMIQTVAGKQYPKVVVLP
jgi:FlaG/FlaF family flagellin (archaellin)